MMASDLIVRPEEQAVRGMELAERMFTPARRRAVAKFLNVESSDPALPAYLAVCASYGLSPVMGQVWLIPVRMKVRDGDVESWQDRYRVAVGRDGLLAVARRDMRWRGMRYGVVCAADSFEVEDGIGPDYPKVLHRFAMKPTTFDTPAAATKYRGPVIGAWAYVRPLESEPEWYFANLREHGRTKEEWTGPSCGTARGTTRRR
jgi:hypothetical protein